MPTGKKKRGPLSESSLGNSSISESLSNLFDLGLYLLGYVFWERGVRQCGCHLLTAVHHPSQKVDDDLTLGRVFRLCWNQQPREARDRVRIFTRSIGDGHTEVSGHRLHGTGGGGYAVERRFHKIPGSVLHAAVRNLVLHGVDELHISDRSLHLADHAGHPLVALATQTDRPFHRRSLADAARPVGTDLGEVIRENVGSAASI